MKSQTLNSPELNLHQAQLMRLRAVEQRTGLRKTALYGLIKTNQFPRPLKVGGASVWVDVEITMWMESLVARRDAAGATR